MGLFGGRAGLAWQFGYSGHHRSVGGHGDEDHEGPKSQNEEYEHLAALSATASFHDYLRPKPSTRTERWADARFTPFGSGVVNSGTAYRQLDCCFNKHFILGG